MIICKHCGKESPKGRGGKKYCSEECCYIATHGKPRQVKPAHCFVCREPLAGRLKTVCSKKCRYKKSGLLQNAKRTEKLSQEKSCVVCQDTFVTNRSNKKNCSKQCSKEYQKIIASKKYYENQAAKPHFKEIECSYCSRPVTVPSSFTQKIVSHPECKAERYKARNRIKRTRRRGYRATLRNISVERMGDRDNWTCHICREPVNPLLPSNHREGASVDHVIPLSRGGSDEPENLKLSHWICNVRKSNKVNYAQSR